MALRGLAGQLVAHLAHDKGWVPKGRISSMVWKHQTGLNYGKTYLADNVGVTLRKLERQGIIAVRHVGKSVDYRWIPHDWRRLYIPQSNRPEEAPEKMWRKDDRKVELSA